MAKLHVSDKLISDLNEKSAKIKDEELEDANNELLAYDNKVIDLNAEIKEYRGVLVTIADNISKDYPIVSKLINEVLDKYKKG